MEILLKCVKIINIIDKFKVLGVYTMDEAIENFKEQHINNYRKAILENIKNNTNILVDEDIMSLVKKPPLDSMDLIKMKFLDVAKKNKIILNVEKIDSILEEYRKKVIKYLEKIRKLRIDTLDKKINDFKISNDTDVFKITKKDLNEINKKWKKDMKEQIKLAIDDVILKQMDEVFVTEMEVATKKKITDEIGKYLHNSYQKQVLENIDFKVLVKDTTLINGIKEQGERYLFTLSNSRLLNEKLDK